MSRKVEKKAAPVSYHLVKYGEDLLMEGVGLDATAYETIKSALPMVNQEKLFGWRNVAILPCGKGEKYLPHPLDTMRAPHTDLAGRVL